MDAAAVAAAAAAAALATRLDIIEQVIGGLNMASVLQRLAVTDQQLVQLGAGGLNSYKDVSTWPSPHGARLPIPPWVVARRVEAQANPGPSYVDLVPTLSNPLVQQLLLQQQTAKGLDRPASMLYEARIVLINVALGQTKLAALTCMREAVYDAVAAGESLSLGDALASLIFYEQWQLDVNVGRLTVIEAFADPSSGGIDAAVCTDRETFGGGETHLFPTRASAAVRARFDAAHAKEAAKARAVRTVDRDHGEPSKGSGFSRQAQGVLRGFAASTRGGGARGGGSGRGAAAVAEADHED